MTPRQIHGLLSRWLGPEGGDAGGITPDRHAQPSRRDEGWSAGQAYAWGNLRRSDEVLLLDVKLVDDALAPHLAAGLERTRNDLTLGRGSTAQHVTLLPSPAHGEFLTPVARADFADLLGQPRSAWVLELRSLTTWRQSGRFLPDPTPRRVFLHLLRKWHGFAPPDLRELGSVDVDRLDLVEVGRELTTVKDYLHGATVEGVRGFVAQRTAAPEPGAREVAGALLGLAAFTGLGYHATHGYGDVVVH